MPLIVYCAVENCSSNREGMCMSAYIHHNSNAVCLDFTSVKDLHAGGSLAEYRYRD